MQAGGCALPSTPDGGLRRGGTPFSVHVGCGAAGAPQAGPASGQKPAALPTGGGPGLPRVGPHRVPAEGLPGRAWHCSLLSGPHMSTRRAGLGPCRAWSWPRAERPELLLSEARAADHRSPSCPLAFPAAPTGRATKMPQSGRGPRVSRATLLLPSWSATSGALRLWGQGSTGTPPPHRESAGHWPSCQRRCSATRTVCFLGFRKPSGGAARSPPAVPHLLFWRKTLPSCPVEPGLWAWVSCPPCCCWLCPGRRLLRLGWAEGVPSKLALLEGARWWPLGPGTLEQGRQAQAGRGRPQLGAAWMRPEEAGGFPGCLGSAELWWVELSQAAGEGGVAGEGLQARQGRERGCV